jgi:deoxyribose-phosphate aldolase
MDYSILTEELYQSKIEAVKDNMERVSKLANSDDMLYKVIMENL